MKTTTTQNEKIIKVTDQEVYKNNLTSRVWEAKYVDEKAGYKTYLISHKYNPSTFIHYFHVKPYENQTEQ